MKIAVVNPNLSGRDFVQCATELGAAVVEVRAPEVTAELDSVTEDLRATRVDAVVPGSESGVAAAEQLSARLGLATNVPALARARRHKDEMMAAVSTAGERIPWSAYVTSLQDLDDALGSAPSGKLIVKPTSSAGSDGVRACSSAEEVVEAVGSLLGRTNYLGLPNEGVLVQEHVEGQQYIVNVVSRRGRHTLSDLHLHEISDFGGKPLVRSRQTVTRLTAAELDMVRYVFRCLDAVGVREGASHNEVRMTPTGPVLIEVNSRLMGVACPSDVYVAANGRSHARDLALSLVDPEAFERASHQPSTADPRSVGGVTLRCFDPGVITSMTGLDLIRAVPCFHSLHRLPALGDPVDLANPMTSGSLGIAFFVGSAEQVRRAIRLTHSLEEAGKIFQIQPDTDRTSR